MVTFTAHFTNSALRSVTTMSKFLDNDVLIGGMVLCCIVLLAVIVVIFVGLALRQFSERFVWLVFLFSVAAVNVALLGLWVEAYIPIDSSSTFVNVPRAAITVSIGLFVRLIFAVLFLMLLFLFLSTGDSKKLAAAFIVAGVLLTMGVAGVIVALFAVPDWASIFSDSYRSPDLIPLMLSPRVMMWGAALAVTVLSLLMAAFLFVLMIRAYRAADSVHESDILRRNALLRNLILCGLMTLILVEQVVLTAMEFPTSPFFSQMLFMFGGFMLPIALLSLLLVAMVLNSWVTSYWIQHKSTTSDVALQAKLLAQPIGRRSNVPSRYDDY